VWGLVAISILFIFFKGDSWNKIENHKNFEVMIMCILYLAIQVLGQSFDGLARMAMYFAPFQMPLFDGIVNKLECNTKKVFMILGSCFFALLFLRSASSEQYKNYLFFWQYAEY
ncbi:MAG: hypothetical protein IJJ69_12810, partial [Oscillospiraceae bacterium]|nr:hypothetical protein [Oscillospiraceae bacterium]